MSQNNTFPKLRNVGGHSITHNGQQGLILRDPLQLSEHNVFVPQELVAALSLLDGTNDIPTVQAKLAARIGMPVPSNLMHDFINALDDAYLLDNHRAAEAMQHAIEIYRAADSRPPASAGISYPAHADQLGKMFNAYLAELYPTPKDRPGIRGVLSPHIDYQRGGPVYARTWASAASAARSAELAVIFGTDHAGSGRVTLTQQSYATPYGIMPTDQAVVSRLGKTLGSDIIFADELHHRAEHSIELSLNWLHHMRGGEPCAVVPILCGSFQEFISGDKSPSDDSTVTLTVEILWEIVSTRRTLFVASADLAHIGPAFDTPPLGWVEKAQTKLADTQLMKAICEGNAEAFFSILKAESDCRNVCGIAPIYFMLRALGETIGEVTGYDRCPADKFNTSIVSIAGIVLD